MAAGSTSTTAPSARRTLPDVATSPSTRTPPATTAAAAAERLMSARRATMRSSRSPCSAAGTRLADHRSGTSCSSATGCPSRHLGRQRPWAARRPAAGEERAEDQQRAADRDGDVGDVEDRPPLHVDEVDDAAAEPAGERNRRSSEVADRAADDQPDGERVHRARRAADRHEQPDHDEQGDDADDRAQAGALGERHPLVERQVEAQRSDDVDVAVGEGVQRPALGQLIEEDDARGDREAGRGASGSRRPRSAERRERHRRPIPPTFSSTRTVAHGMASSRSRGIGRPDTTE